jgi:phage tail-like protein
MNAPSRLPRVPEPPHDPKSLLLAGWIGPEPMAGWRWRKLVGTQVTAPGAPLQLAPTPDSSRRLTEANGTIGGLRLPPNMAIGPGGQIILLDRIAGTLHVFDACACAFVPLPCGILAMPPAEGCLAPAEGPGKRPAPVALNRLWEPSAIAICENQLAIADTGHARVILYSVAGYVPRASLALPAAERAALGAPWRPVDVAFDGHGRLLVLDATHGRIDRFDPGGRWLGPAVAAPGAVRLFIDCSDTPVVVVRSWHAATPAALTQARYVELDSGEEQTDWQALQLDGIVPGSSFDVAAMTADAPIGTAQAALLPEADWRRIAVKVDAASDGKALPLVLDIGRCLRLRFTPRTGAPSLVVTATAALALRLGAAAPTPLDVRSERLDARARLDAVLPLQVDPNGLLFVLCDDGCGGSTWRGFDDRGRSRPGATPPTWRFKRLGTALTTVLDSSIDGCPWHRVELRGTIPPGCSIEVRTTTAPIAFDATEVDTLDDSAWCTRNILGAASGTRHDCLVLSPPGRFLWLQLTLRGDGATTPRIESALVEFPRVSLRRYLPAVFGEDPVGGDFTDRFSALFDATLRSIEAPIDRLPSYFDPLSTPSGAAAGGRDFLSWLAGWIGEVAVRELPEAQRRWMLKQAACLYAMRGTRAGLHRQLLLLLGFDRAHDACADVRPLTRCVPLPLNCAPPPPCTPVEPPPLILEHYRLRRWLHAGIGRLGDDSRLWGASLVDRSQLGTNAQVGVTQIVSTPDPLRDPFHVYAHRFSVFVPANVRQCPAVDRALNLLLARETPAHAEVNVEYVAPRFRVGQQAMVGLDSVVARTPSGVSLVPGTLPSDGPAVPLGQGSVLSGAPNAGKSPRVGQTRVGAGTVLG